MDFFFKPKGIALIGASANPAKGGYHILKNLKVGFKRNIYPVNPGYTEIEGLKSYSSVLEVPDPVDLAIVFIPAPMVPQVVHQCAERGIKGVMIQSAGFAESGEKGKALQQEIIMMDLCRALAQYPDIPREKSGRVAILTMSGAAGILSTDFIDQNGLSVANLSHDTEEALKKLFPDWMPITNPIDLWPAVKLHGRKKAFGEAFRVVCQDPNVDAILIHLFVFASVSKANISQLVEMAKAADKPLFCWLMGKRMEVHGRIIDC